MSLADALGREAFAEIAADPVMFVKAFDREPWPYQADILRAALERGPDGKFAHRVVVISLPRQNGKTTLSAWAALWRLFCEGDEQTIVSVANDTEQAKIILGDARRIIRNSGILYGLLDDDGLTKQEIRLRNGARWLVKSSEHVSSRGLRPSTVCYDELGWTVDRSLFDALSAGQAAQPNPLIIVTSTVGPVKAGTLWELFESARAGDTSVCLLYRTENESPLITPEYLEQERALQPANVYAREHGNLWTEGAEVLCTEADWKRATDAGDPRRYDAPGPSFAFVDLGWVHDETVIAAVTRDPGGKLAVIALEVFTGTHARPVEFASVEATLKDLAPRLNIRRAQIESPQGVGMAQRVALDGVPCDVVYPTAKTNAEHWGELYSELKAGAVQLPNDAKLRRQLLTLTIASTPTGWRVEDAPGIHNDRARAIAGAVYLARVSGEPVPAGVMARIVTNTAGGRWGLAVRPEPGLEGRWQRRDFSRSWHSRR